LKCAGSFKSLAQDLRMVPDSCDSRAYQGGKTFDLCRQEARRNSAELAGEIERLGQVSWTRVLEAAGHDEIVYKLSLKYLREAGYDIGNSSVPRVATKQMRK
jgi:hypothetical protein